jgi:hypothetical protein
MARKKKPKQIFKDIIPVESMFDEEEAAMYKEYVKVYMEDFEDEDLTAGDLDDLTDLAKNKVLEYRLLKAVKEGVHTHMDIAQSLERISKQNKTFKENLATRRKDRINPNEYKGFSIVDLAVAFDNVKKQELKDRIRQNKQEEEAVLKSREGYVGNKYDKDGPSKNSDKDE